MATTNLAQTRKIALALPEKPDQCAPHDMAVALVSPLASAIQAVPGVDVGWAQAAIRKPDRKDLVVLRLAKGSIVAGVFTQNRFCAAPVVVCREHLAATREIRALVINTGNANAGTGESGLLHARQTCESLAALLGIQAHEVLPFSTGVILEPLPIERLLAGLPAALASLAPDQWLQAAQGIMTTDTVAKAISSTVTLGQTPIHITGIAKGAGMIHPNMATMLGYVACDAKISPDVLDVVVKRIADASFNRICVDGDTSTNDAFILIATGVADHPTIDRLDHPALPALEAALTQVAQKLAQAIVRDGEGASKFITVNVEGGKSTDECLAVAYAVARSPLVKTAFFASDPNLGRILAAIGYSGIADLDVQRVELYLGDVRVACNGSRAPEYREEEGQRVMKAAEIEVTIRLGRGQARQTVWTCDFSHDYVTINAEYRT